MRGKQGKWGMWTAAAALLAAAGGCGDSGGSGGSLQVIVQPEDVIVNGLQPGSDVENIKDRYGWRVEFSKYVVAIGAVELDLQTDASIQAHDDTVVAFDLTQVSAAGTALTTLADLRAGRWDIAYQTPVATADTTAAAATDAADLALMVSNGWSHYIVGTLSADAGEVCPPQALATPPEGVESVGTDDYGNPCYAAPEPLRFEIGADAETVFGPCSIDGVNGISIPDGGVQTVALTIHGDHLFFNGFPSGTEGGVTRLAQWLANADLNLDGDITNAELAAIAVDQMDEFDSRYALESPPITPLTTLADYARAQLKTQGHIQGEGECAIDGVAHEQDHDH